MRVIGLICFGVGCSDKFRVRSDSESNSLLSHLLTILYSTYTASKNYDFRCFLGIIGTKF